MEAETEWALACDFSTPTKQICRTYANRGGVCQSQRRTQSYRATGGSQHLVKADFMLRYTAIFLIVAIIAAAFGFGGIAGTAASIAKVLFFIFLVLFLVSLLLGRNPRV